MRRIGQKFQELKTAGAKAFIPFIVAGDPDLETTVRLVPELQRAGSHIVELGIPFSDPVADG
ncbi:MAG: tryptophan synthase subunit alpha, partial [Acidobacteriota bacterium]